MKITTIGADHHSYIVLIEWSDENQAYLVSFPEISTQYHTHGDTELEAFGNAKEVLDILTEEETYS